MTSFALPLVDPGLVSPRLRQLIHRPLDNTALSTFTTCPVKFLYSMMMHRRGEEKSVPALSYGTTWHKIMETHYKTGGDFDAVSIAAIQSWKPHDKIGDHRTIERCLLEYRKYVAKYGMPLDEQGQTIGFPHNPMVEMAVDVLGGGLRYPYCGKIDRIIEWDGKYYVEDHKTTRQMGDYYFDQFQLKNQMIGYAYIGSLILGKPVTGVRINAHCVRQKDSEFRRKVIGFDKKLLDQWADNYNRWVDRIADCIEKDEWQNNFDACDGKYRMCQYITICSLRPDIRLKALEQSFSIEPWNPLDAEDDEVSIDA